MCGWKNIIYKIMDDKIMDGKFWMKGGFPLLKFVDERRLI